MQAYVLPPTNLKVPLLDDAQAAEEALTGALAKNKERKMPVAGISLHQAETLMQWVVYRTRKCLFERKLESAPSSPVMLFTQPQQVTGQCIASSAIASVQFELLGAEVIAHHTENLNTSMVNSHLFLVVKMPVTDQNGKVGMKPYLVDTTFQQFFEPAFFEPGSKSHWANKLLRKEGGKDFADELLAHGFVALTEKNAGLYLNSHAESSMGLSRDLPLDVLLHNSSHVPLSEDVSNWDEAVQNTMDIRTPTMIAEGFSRTDALARYNALPATRLSSVIGEGKLQKSPRAQAKSGERFN